MTRINPKPIKPPANDPNDPRFWDERDLETEARRVFEICHSCRMCVNFCGSFPDLFARVDRDIEQKDAHGAELLDDKDLTSVVDLC
jgi:glycerol-3-phosphate dehydrogenase subunit C